MHFIIRRMAIVFLILISTQLPAMDLASAAIMDPLDRTNHELCLACYEGNIEKVKMLLAKPGIDVNIPYLETTPLMEAAYNGYPEIVQLLVEKGAHVNAHRNACQAGTPFTLAIDSLDREYWRSKKFGPVKKYKRFYRIIEYLYAHGAHIDSQESDGTTALMGASSNPWIVKFLISHGANIQIKDCNGKTALHYAHEGLCDAIERQEKIKDCTFTVNLLERMTQAHTILHCLLSSSDLLKGTDLDQFHNEFPPDVAFGVMQPIISALLKDE